MEGITVSKTSAIEGDGNNMSGIIRVEKNGNYTVLHRAALNDSRLSWKAKGIIAYMLSMPDDWFFYLEELIKHSSDGEKAFRSGFNELKKYGYVKRFPVYENKKIVRWETIVFESPQTTENDLLSQNVQVGNVNVGFVDVGNEVLLNTDSLLNTELLNTDCKDIVEIPYEEIISYLNLRASTNYRHTTSKTKQLIKARFKDGFTVEDFKMVIDKKVQSWLNDFTMNKFLRPETLFGTKFESYLNEKVGGNNAKYQRNQTTTSFADGINF